MFFPFIHVQVNGMAINYEVNAARKYHIRSFFLHRSVFYGDDTFAQGFPPQPPVSHHCFYVVKTPTVCLRQERESSMCVAVPAEVLEIREGNIGLVDYGDLRQEVRLDLVDVKVGEFVLVHVGFAIQRLSREEGLETREVFKQVYAAMEE